MELKFDFGQGFWKTFEQGIEREWVVTNGLGGHCGSSIIDASTRKHHGLLIASLQAPVRRYLILSKLNEEISIGDKTYPLCTSKYKTSITEGYKHLQRFSYDTFPTYTYQVENVFIKKEILLDYGKNSSIIRLTVMTGNQNAKLHFKPSFNFRPQGDSSTIENLIFETHLSSNTLTLIPESEKTQQIRYQISEGELHKSHTKSLYDFDNYYDIEFATGMNGIDSHYTPISHMFSVDANSMKTIYIHCEINTLEINTLENIPNSDINGSSSSSSSSISSNSQIISYCEDVFIRHYKRVNEMLTTAGLKSPLANRLVYAADQFIVHRKSTGLKTVLAGLPWFSDWGRDTMIALQGLTLATGQYATCRDILKSFSLYEENGLIPNMFPDENTDPLYNSVDASLWYFHSIHEYFKATKDLGLVQELYPTLTRIIESFIKGTDFSIYMDTDSLIHAGSGLDQVTWMDVRINGVVVTPRHGKPVEINALWYNALMVMDNLSKVLRIENQYYNLAEKVKQSFNKKFWNPTENCLFDVIDHNDPSLRPNQIYAVSLPFSMLDLKKSRQVTETVYKELYATYGLKSLNASNPDYKGIYKGELIHRDFAYHQGTAWGFLIGGFISAYKKCYFDDPSLKTRIDNFIQPFKDHLYDGCIGSIAEIFDGDSPHVSRGCYAQAWSVGEVLRILYEEEKDDV